MPSAKEVTPEFLLWCQMFFVWSAAAYGVTADPLKGESANFPWARWYSLLVFRALSAFGVSYALSRSLVLSVFLSFVALLQPLSRYRLPMRWLAELEACCLATFLSASLAIIRYLHVTPSRIPANIRSSQLGALCVLAGTLLFVVRGGTYIVRGVLKKSGALKPRDRVHHSDTNKASEDFLPMIIDVEEYNRGRLIGNLERIVLTIVVAAGSYAALGFLVAAKGLVRFEEFEKSRDFTEYFLIGTLSSVLVALFAGILLRIAFVHLWPDLFTLQMQ